MRALVLEPQSVEPEGMLGYWIECASTILSLANYFCNYIRFKLYSVGIFTRCYYLRRARIHAFIKGCTRAWNYIGLNEFQETGVTSAEPVSAKSVVLVVSLARWTKKTHKYLPFWMVFTQLLFLLLISYKTMQFNIRVVFITAVLAAAPALSASVTAFAGAGCTGSIVSSASIGTGCLVFTNGGSARSWSYSGVPHSIAFFESGGAHDGCTNGAFETLGAGSGCATAPAGFNIESASVS
ncbi:hypothetical protein BT96DRAFT_979525 [Gymnopus androsaceus JB14]|uniref:Uncharacterized protein n=1 Tax=Gymnopus androsaceus JB14 TaxID=1447944 RepID=A0A6A4H235_9AGAR|nr:hypothetical protein BT96DRAFT_979525 [Gymnopus androsaceus JB14]